MRLKNAGLPLLAVILCLTVLTACTGNEQTVNESTKQQSDQEETETPNTVSDPKNDKTSKQANSKQQDDDNQNKDNTNNNASQQEKDEPENKKNKESSNNDNASSDNDDDEELLPNDTLTESDQGKQVKKVQSALNRIGYSLTEDGVFGPATMWAVKDFQAQQSALKVDGVYGPGTRDILKEALNGQLSITPGSGIKKEKQNEEQNEEKSEENPDDNQNNQNQSNVISDPSSFLALVNKSHQLPAGYVPDNLVIPDVSFPFDADLPKKQMRQTAANALEKMFAAGDKAGVDLFAQSGYRSYDRQEAIFASNVQDHGKQEANQFSAQAGESEHQTGLTMDVTSADIGFKLTSEFANTDEGEWVKQHASEYGFIIRYPKGKTNITGYQYEPWHLRYVGKNDAKAIDEQNITLEEFLGVR